MAMMLVSATEEGVVSSDITDVTGDPLFMNPERIVNGLEVNPPRKYPYMIAMTPSRWMRCGGSLVAPNVMLTAAQCAGIATSVQIGRHDLANPNESYETFDVLEIVPHPKYHSINAYEYDFMMVKLSGNSAFEPVELDDSGTLPNDSDLITMGWGRTYGVLKEVNVQSDSSCGYYPSNLKPQMFCSNDFSTESCIGDPGGPIIRQESGKLVGVVFDNACFYENSPSVYSGVNDQLPWIRSYIDAWSTPIPTPNPTRDGIVDGIEVNPPRKYPFMITFLPFGCGGSLVATNVVLTAARCIGPITGVQIGRHDLANPNESYETFDVLENVPHPSYHLITAELHHHKVVFVSVY